MVHRVAQSWTQLKWLSTLKDTWLVSSFWLSWIKHLWTFVCKFCVNVRFHISEINAQLIKLFRSNWSSNIFMLSYRKVKVKVAQLCPTLCSLVDYSVHGILQARVLEWVAFSFSVGSSQPRDRTQVSHIAGGFFTSWTTREAQEYWSG